MVGEGRIQASLFSISPHEMVDIDPDVDCNQLNMDALLVMSHSDEWGSPEKGRSHNPYGKRFIGR